MEEMGRLQDSVRTRTYVEPSKQTLASYMSEWLDTQSATGLERSTISGYRYLLETYAIPELGDTLLQGLESLMLDRLYAKMLKEGRRQRAGGLSPRTTRFLHTVVRKALEDAVRKGLVVSNVADRARPPSAKSAQPPEMDFWTPSELHAFLRSLDSRDRLYTMWRVLAFTGLRRGEVAGLRWQDVDLKGDDRARRSVVIQVTVPIWHE